jgi:hypothetical protein
MVKIGDNAPFAPTRRLDNKRKTTSTGFTQSLNETNAPQETSQISSAPEVAPLQPLMHLQEVSDALQGKARACARAQDLLNVLDVLREGLLIGAFASQDLAHMAQQLGIRSQENIDPLLKEVLEQIEQRVHIELTKIELSQNGIHF